MAGGLGQLALEVGLGLQCGKSAQHPRYNIRNPGSYVVSDSAVRIVVFHFESNRIVSLLFEISNRIE